MPLTSASTGLTPGKDDKNKNQKHIYVAVTDKTAKAQVGENSNGRRDCLPVPFSQNQEHGMGRSDMSLSGVGFLQLSHRQRMDYNGFLYTPPESLLTVLYSVLCLVLRDDPSCLPLALKGLDFSANFRVSSDFFFHL